MTVSQQRSKTKFCPLVASLLLVIATVLPATDFGHASAAALTNTTVRLDRLSFSTATGGLVCTQPKTSGASITSVAVTFPTNAITDYSFGALASLTATGTSNTSLNGIAWPNLTSVTPTNAGKTLTWAMSAASTLVNTQVYCFQFANGLTTANNNTENLTGTVVTQSAGNTPVDNGPFSIGLAAPTSGIGDQVAITGGIVPPTFKFALDGNTDAFIGTISLGTIAATNGRNISIITNAANGYVVWAKDAATSGSTGTGTGVGSLVSVNAASKLFGSTAVGTGASRTLTTSGNQDYGMGVTVTGGGTANINYIQNGASNQVGTLDPGNLQPIASSGAPSAGSNVNVIERATSSTTTKAANDYADTINFTGAGLF